jgi:hypothetical protein
MISWYQSLPVIGKFLFWGIVVGLAYAISFAIISGEPLMGVIGFPMGILSGLAVYRYANKRHGL